MSFALLVQRIARVAGNVQDAEDLVQEAFLIAWETRGDAPAEPRGWAHVVARRRGADLVRRRAAERRALLRAASMDVIDLVEADVADGVVRRIVAAAEADLLASLPPTTRRVIASLAEGHDRRDTGARLGLSTRALEGHLRRAREAIRRKRRAGEAQPASVLGGAGRPGSTPVTGAVAAPSSTPGRAGRATAPAVDGQPSSSSDRFCVQAASHGTAL